MSICDNCIHDKVCGLEDNHEEAITFCADMIPKDILNKIKAEIEDTGAYEQEVNGKTEFLEGTAYCLNIIEKYEAEYIEPKREPIKMHKDDPSIQELFKINYDAGYKKGFDDGCSIRKEKGGEVEDASISNKHNN